ncbi:hypothetical protein QFC19_004521 [Naganishia cerealis]|uniref:Uncharacterized protein n=1 Tax=Naganishia cerealis TaxID=610337 RepID=A0ACC2VV60_9TREE|nr:hypothetical protein QFC19_004521 [Naganishia cerealis]
MAALLCSRTAPPQPPTGRKSVVRRFVKVWNGSYVDFDLNPDLELASQVTALLQDAGFDAALEPKFEQIHDTFMILKWMFPGGKSLPHVIVSHNARFDPHFHMKMGAALRPLRKQKVLILGSGGAVHNLYRNNWHQVIKYRDNLAQERPPEQWAGL